MISVSRHGLVFNGIKVSGLGMDRPLEFRVLVLGAGVGISMRCGHGMENGSAV